MRNEIAGFLAALLLLPAMADTGLKGRTASLFDRIDATNARAGAEGRFELAAWRGERVHAQGVVWSDRDEGRLVASATDLVSSGGATIAAGRVTARFVRVANAKLHFEDTARVPVGDCLDPAADAWPKEAFRAVWWTVDVPADVAPGVYTGAFTVKGASGEVRFPVSLAVGARTLPAPKDRKFVLNLWQHPWSVAYYYGDKPFSEAHYRHLEPLYRELAAAGQKSIDTSITDLPWGEGYAYSRGEIRTMVKSFRRADGTWRYDYADFDSFVAFAKKCGIGPQIHLYTVVKFNNKHAFYFTDEATGERFVEELYEGTPAYEAFMTPLLKSLVAHLREKGWLNDAYIAIDEVAPERLVTVRKFLKRVAPELKFALASNVDPLRYQDLTDDTDVFSQILWTGHGITTLFDARFEKFHARRREKGQVTTFYVCTQPQKPNTWFKSPLAETAWLGLYAAAKRYDGFLRWATFFWGKDPFEKPEGLGYPTGEDFLLYPGGLASVRWEILRDSIENWEKIRVLRETGALSPALERALGQLDYFAVNADDAATTRGKVEAVLRELADETPAAKEWESTGREKTLAWFRENWFGVRPSEARPADEKIGEDYVECAGGKIRINIYAKLPEGASAENPAPLFILGDHYNATTSATKTDTMPGMPTNAIVSRGYAYVRWNFNDVTPNSWNGCFEECSANRKLGGMGQTNSWGTISAWAWGFSRVIDWVETRPELDAKRIAVIGHSRGGKTALWAGCNDRRIALTISNCSGTGGARYLHLPLPGMETLDWMKDHSTRHWFCPSWIPTYRNRETEIEHDADEMLSLVAPRLLYVASGSDDHWAGPAGEFESAKRASARWADYGEKGLSLEKFPAPGTWDHSGKVAYHLRKGPHALSPWDWERYMDYMDRHLPGKAGSRPAFASPESQGVPSVAITNWISVCEREIDALHGFTILRHGVKIAEGTWAPFDTLTKPHMLYSHSKSFTATAIGFLVDAGKLDLDERVVDIFADKAPANPSDNLKALRVRDLLTMNVGANRTDPEDKDIGGDWEKLFLTNEINVKPGTRFRYDSSATYMLAAIVGRKSGKNLMAFLKEKLFDKIGITSAWSSTCPNGTPCGGWGMYMTTGDMARFGQFLLNEGTWNGERILSAEWIRLATSRQTWSGPIAITGQSGNDWSQGYGFQFWRCRHDAYRADGAAGQFTVVVPKEGLVVSLHAGCNTSPKELETVWDHLLTALKDAPLKDDPAALKTLRERCASLAIPPLAGAASGAERYLGKTFAFEKNVRRFKTIRLERDAAGLSMSLETPAGMQKLPVGFGEWKAGEIVVDPENYEGLGMYVGRHPTAASAAVGADGALKVRVYVTDTPGRFDFTFAETNGTMSVAGDLSIMRGCELKALTSHGENLLSRNGR